MTGNTRARPRRLLFLCLMLLTLSAVRFGVVAQQQNETPPFFGPGGPSPGGPDGGRRGGFGALVYQVSAPESDSSPLVINEFMADNASTVADPQNEFDDWIEIFNVSDREVDLSGMYLSDKEDNPRKWKIPEGTRLAPGAYLLVWADEDDNAKPGLHANFKLSKEGELVTLHDTDARGNQLLDAIEFGPQKENVSFGRVRDGAEELGFLVPTPNAANKTREGRP